MPETEIDSNLALAVGIAKGEWPHTTDAQDWVTHWMQHIEKNPSIATDEGAMIGWFANAVMAGYDKACFDLQQPAGKLCETR